MIRFGVVMPVRDEEELVSVALEALDRAVGAVSALPVTVGTAIVLDRCRDRSNERVAEWRRRCRATRVVDHVEIIETDVGNVGRARRLGCQALLQRWSTIPLASIWLGTTDADSEVPHDWISAQLRVREEGGQLWVGSVSVRDWSGRAPGTAEEWSRQYETERLPVHGANLGIAADTYVELGGFEGLSTGEDRDLFERAVALGALIRHDPRVRVVTSCRRQARAPGGFAHALSSVEQILPSLTVGDGGGLTAPAIPA